MKTIATRKQAVLSDCGTYRYRLWRKWGCGSPLLFVMLNPSTADAEVDDATIRRCLGFADAHGFGELEVVNLYAYRATDPADLKRAGYPVGPDNDAHIEDAMHACAAVERRRNGDLPLSPAGWQADEPRD